ncbi:MAG: 1-acyl-sn-glycerol-3-phosphate acyltransferase [Flavobacteriales bacterium]|nr:1-acyl-sn-glycerol-3-phosphate acyltransferase [Flavobacteriales bacterium]
MQDISDPFIDIRPYNDDEVSGAIQRLINDDEFISAIVQYQSPILSKLCSLPLKFLTKRYLAKQWSQIDNVHDVQMQVSKYMKSMLSNTCEGLTSSGIEQLDQNKSYLFVSNHRDIAMDPALVNWCLHENGFDTVRIAIGDNLLTKPCATELMRLNKSFIVKRSTKAPREMLSAFSQLSKYISVSLDENQSIWIAQKEGRAKDGNDKTDAAILKMFYMEGRKQKRDFSEYISSLNIVPVSISYENDPCDLIKAKELYTRETQGIYQKTEFEDIDNIIKGIVGYKRRVHVAFGDVIGDQFSSPAELAKEIDRQIYTNYHLFPSNYIAAKMNHESITDHERELFERRLVFANNGIRKIIENMYAAPIMNRESLKKLI